MAAPFFDVRGRGHCLLCDGFRRVVGVRAVARVSIGVLLLVSSASRAPLSQGRARFLCPRAVRWRGVGRWMRRDTVVYRVLDVVREFFLGEGVPDWAARGVADQGQRANVAHLEAAAVALNARR